MATTYPKITNTHQWIRINLGNNRGLTASYSGTKATGSIPLEVFQLWSDALEYKESALARLGLTKNDGVAKGKIIEIFASRIDQIWPGWNVAPAIPAVGSEVVFDHL